MTNVNYFLLEIERCAEESISILKSMLMMPRTSNNTYIIRSIYIFSDMLSSVSFILKEKGLDEDSEELKYHIQAVYECATAIMEMDRMNKRTANKSLYGELTQRLKALISSIQDLLTEMVVEIVNLYDYREVTYIVNPAYQALSGIWTEYRKLVKTQESQVV